MNSMNYITFFKRHGYGMPNQQFRQLCEVGTFDPETVKSLAHDIGYEYFPEFKVTLSEQITEFFPQMLPM